MTGPNSIQYQHRRDVEDMIALITDIERTRAIIAKHAWHETDWEFVWAEAIGMRVSVEELRAVLGRCWCDIQEFIDRGRDA